MLEKRIVLRDVAEKAQVHLTTAARALKNDPRVQPETLARIQAIAKEMGYMPDPMLASLSTYRTATRPLRYHGTIAWITNFPDREGWRCEAFEFYRRGAAESLTRHGYLVEDFWLREPGLNSRRVGQILRSRGIRGLLIAPLPNGSSRLSLPWDQFAAITFGYTLRSPALHMVTAYHYQNMQTCLRQLHHLGYRRPGLVTWDDISKRVYELWTAAYRTPPFVGKWDGETPILQLEKRPDLFSDANRKVFLQWVKTRRPDAVLVVDRHILDWLTEAGYRVPADIAYVSPSLQESNRDHAGVLEPSLDVGRAAGDYLAGMLSRGEFGVPAVPRRILLEGFWQPGATVRATAQSRGLAPAAR